MGLTNLQHKNCHINNVNMFGWLNCVELDEQIMQNYGSKFEEKGSLQKGRLRREVNISNEKSCEEQIAIFPFTVILV
jgi:hypothetical protein